MNEKLLLRAINLINDKSKGEIFSLKELFADEWREVEKGQKISFGLYFAKKVKFGEISCVKPNENKEDNNTQKYIKIK